MPSAYERSLVRQHDKHSFLGTRGYSPTVDFTAEAMLWARYDSQLAQLVQKLEQILHDRHVCVPIAIHKCLKILKANPFKVNRYNLLRTHLDDYRCKLVPKLSRDASLLKYSNCQSTPQQRKLARVCLAKLPGLEKENSSAIVCQSQSAYSSNTLQVMESASVISRLRRNLASKDKALANASQQNEALKELLAKATDQKLLLQNNIEDLQAKKLVLQQSLTNISNSHSQFKKRFKDIAKSPSFLYIEQLREREAEILSIWLAYERRKGSSNERQ